MNQSNRNWKTTLGFILSTSGAAVGFGNIQRFPYITALSGGAGFLIIYLLCVVILGLPLILNEFSIGRHTSRNPVCAIDKIRPKSPWRLAGFLGIFVAFFILSYYSVIGSWAVGYTINMLFSIKSDFSLLSANPFFVFPCFITFLAATMIIVSRGIHKGIEKTNKVLMPLLVILLLILIGRSLFLKNSLEGLKYYLLLDFSKINGKVLLLALSQAFFSLCIGEAVLITYGSYATKKENLLSSAGYVALFDTLIAFFAGLVIFPAVFAFNLSPNQGIGLSFIVLPDIFSKMFAGNIFGALFFLLLTFAGLSTAIALLEIPVIYLIDAKKWKRKNAVLLVGFSAFIVGIPSALSKGICPFLSDFKIEIIEQTGFLNLMDFVWGNLGMVITGWFLAIFTGWVWGVDEAIKELKISCPYFDKYQTIWKYSIKYVAPVVIFLILLELF